MPLAFVSAKCSADLNANRVSTSKLRSATLVVPNVPSHGRLATFMREQAEVRSAAQVAMEAVWSTTELSMLDSQNCFARDRLISSHKLVLC